MKLLSCIFAVLLSCSAYCVDTTHDQYIYVAHQLGILAPAGSTGREFAACIKKYMLPLSLGIGAFTGVLILSDMLTDDRLKVPFTNIQLVLPEAYQGVTGGVAGISIALLLMTALGERYANRDALQMSSFVKFVKGWPIHKTNTPKELHQLFDQLYLEFEKNGCVSVDRELVRALYLVVSESVIMSTREVVYTN